MNHNDLLTLLIAFVFGYFAHQMMRNMCGNRLIEGDRSADCNTCWNPFSSDVDDTELDIACNNCVGIKN